MTTRLAAAAPCSGITELQLALCAQAPQLEGFMNLALLTLHVGGDTTPDLSGFGPMPKLKVLKISGNRWNSKGRLVSLQACPQLQTAGIPLSITDASALQALASVTIRIDLNELGLPAKKGDLMALHTAFINAINTLPSVKLELKGPSGSWYSQSHIDMTVFRRA
jgi:hypothetical protein